MSDAGDAYDPDQPISVLGDAVLPPQWPVGSDDSQPSILGPALNPEPWTPAQNSLQMIVDPDTMAKIDFAGTGQPQPPQPDASGFTGLTPWQPDTSGNGQGQNAIAQQPAPPDDGGSAADGSLQSPLPDGAAAEVGEYTLPGLGKTYLDPQFAGKVGTLIDTAQKQNIPLQFTSGYRDPAQQAALKNDPNAITPADQSLHSAGLSVDVNWNALSPEDRTKLLSAATDAGLSWGGNFHKPDAVHFYSDPGTDRAQLIDNFSRGIAVLRNQIPDN